jgi:hypothetical protein
MKAGGTATAVITATTPAGTKERIRAPVRVLALYSAMLHNMLLVRTRRPRRSGCPRASF